MDVSRLGVCVFFIMCRAQTHILLHVLLKPIFFLKSATQGWRCTFVIPALRRLRQEDRLFEVSLGYETISLGWPLKWEEVDSFCSSLE